VAIDTHSVHEQVGTDYGGPLSATLPADGGLDQSHLHRPQPGHSTWSHTEHGNQKLAPHIRIGKQYGGAGPDSSSRGFALEDGVWRSPQIVFSKYAVDLPVVRKALALKW
jgi:hypothetical protein